jgi:hypothetical protein
MAANAEPAPQARGSSASPAREPPGSGVASHLADQLGAGNAVLDFPILELIEVNPIGQNTARPRQLALGAHIYAE